MNGHANGIDYEHHSSKYHQKLGSNDYQVFPYSTMQQYPFSTNYQIDNYGFYSNDAYHQDDTRMNTQFNIQPTQYLHSQHNTILSNQIQQPNSSSCPGLRKRSSSIAANIPQNRLIYPQQDFNGYGLINQSIDFDQSIDNQSNYNQSMTHSFSEPPIHPPNVQMKNASTQEDGETWLTMLVEDPDLHAPDATKLDLSSIIEKQITTNAQNQPNNETEYAISTHLHSSHHISIHSSPLSNSFRGQETQSVIPVFKNQDNAFYYPSLNKCCQTEPSFKSPPTVSMNMIHANQSPPNLDHQYLNPQADNPNHFENARLKFTSSSQVFKKSYGKFVNALDIVASNSLARMHRFSRENSSMSTLAISEYTGTIE